MNPATGRFVTTDPWMGNIHEPVSLHKYLYANANPVILLDPSGKMSIGQLSASIAIISLLSIISSDSSISHGEAWTHTKQEWSTTDIQGYRNFVTNNYFKYSNRSVDCAGLAITILIDYASLNGLPINLKGYYFQSFDSDKTHLKNKYAFLVAARNGLCASEIYDNNTYEKGSLPGSINSALPGDLMMSRGFPNTFIQDIFGNPNPIYGHTRIFLGYNNMVDYIAGDLATPPTVSVRSKTPADIAILTTSLRFWKASVFK